MNKSTQKIIIIAVSVIIVIVAATAGALILPGFMNKEEATQPTTNYERPTAEAPTYSFETPSVDESLPSVAETLLDATQNAVNPNNKPTSNKPAPTKAPANNNQGGSNANPNYKDTESGLNVKDLIDEDGVQALGYRYSNEGDGYYYPDDKDCWQRNAGYNEVYDNMAPMTAMFIDQVRLRFNYGGKDWMIQLWKGQYGLIFYGAEVGVYTKPKDRVLMHYDCATDEEMLKMSMVFNEYKNGKWQQRFTRPYGYYWWCTGFVPGNKFGDFSGLSLDMRITAKDYDMLRGIKAALEENNVSYTVSGLNLYFRFS